jgi:hypothetical protein
MKNMVLQPLHKNPEGEAGKVSLTGGVLGSANEELDAGASHR